MIYLDNAASTQPYKEVLYYTNEINQKYYGNPSSTHIMGQQAHNILTGFRKSFANMIGADPSEVFFTSGGSESNNWVILSACKWGYVNNKREIIVSSIEHHSVLKALEQFSGFNIIYINPDRYGLIDFHEVEARISENTCLVSIQAVNNEVGTIQPYEDIGRICKNKGVLFHTDATQAVPHIKFSLKEQPIDFLTCSGHKFGGLRGAGVLYKSNSISDKILTPLIYGGAQEQGYRAGTENLAAIGAMVKALAITQQKNKIEAQTQHLRKLKVKLLMELFRMGCAVNGRYTIDTIVNFSLPRNLDGEAMLMWFSKKGICVSAGSACTAGDPSPSHVLKAMGLSDKKANSSIRVSMGFDTTEQEVSDFITALKDGIEFFGKA